MGRDGVGGEETDGLGENIGGFDIEKPSANFGVATFPV